MHTEVFQEDGALQNWTRWRAFPNPQNGEYLNAPLGPGCYEVRNSKTRKLILCGKSNNTAARMSSLLPKPLGTGTRKNSQKRKYIMKHLARIEYRTIAFSKVKQAMEFEKGLLSIKPYKFPT